MSLLRRKRRQNRLAQKLSPATREVRPSLESLGVRGLRTNIRSVRLSPQRERKTLRTVIELPNNELRLDLNREIKQAQAIHEYNKIRAKDAKHAVKPLSTIRLDGKVVVDLPPEHPICRQREERRAVLFATGKGGKGGQKMRRVNNDIKLRCK